MDESRRRRKAVDVRKVVYIAAVTPDAASAEDATLLVDEAGAILGRRTDVRDAHDRFANDEAKSAAADDD